MPVSAQPPSSDQSPSAALQKHAFMLVEDHAAHVELRCDIPEVVPELQRKLVGGPSVDRDGIDLE